jgi:hypothetical protein
MINRHVFPRQTHATALLRRMTPTFFQNDESLLDYTKVPVGWQIVGRLSTGQATKSTIHCETCGRVGVLASSTSRELVVHRGRVRDDVLYAVDHCELLVTVH